MGHIDEDMVHDKARQQIVALLDGKAPSRDPQGEAYRLLVVAACNFWNKAMPLLFQRIDDYTELLMPDDLLSGNSILACTREAMTPDACEDVEVIGWLYQFYISEKKDEVFEGLKKNRKITPKNIPAATQLFTPHWIVRYLVENSLGRLWMLNRPGSKLAEQMDYYIRPEQPETDFLRIRKPEEIKICDPACGSGHMLTYAFDLLHAIYEEEGYDPAAIPQKILTNNLYGIEIDERAGELAAFALTMKARAKQRRLFDKGVKPKICVLENIRFKEDELHEYMGFVGCDLFTASLQTTLRQFEEADNFGSLIRPDVTDVDGILQMLEARDVSGQLFLSDTHKKVLQALRQVDYLSPKYHVVIANPPYMSHGGMNERLRVFSQDYYPNSSADLFAMFIERNLNLTKIHGVISMITMQSWMSLSSFENMRVRILDNTTILSMAHLGPKAFDSIGGEVVSTTAFVIEKYIKPKYKGVYLRLIDGNSESEKESLLREKRNSPYYSCSSEFQKIPSNPIAYWLSKPTVTLYSNKSINEFFDAKEGVGTRNDEVFMRMFWEVPIENISRDKRWILIDKAGDTRRWYMGFSFLMDWEDDGYRIKNYRNEDGSLRSRPQNISYLFREGVTWGKVGTGIPCFRWRPKSYGFNDAAPTLFGQNVYKMLAQMNSKVIRLLLDIRGGTINKTTGVIGELPYLPVDRFEDELNSLITRGIDIAKYDWDSHETSWDFTTLPLLHPAYRQPTLQATYNKHRTRWRETTLEMQRLEEENNRIFIDAYGLQDELTPEVPLNEITLTCNPHYRYAGDRSEDELEALLLADTMRKLVSYAVGCMFGRYALDKQGLILANQGETIEDYLKQVPEPSFPADDDNVIPMLDGDWFTDDITERFCRFLRVAFGREHYQENLQFVEKALNLKGKHDYSIRNYFLGEFYNDHVKRYRKRPIYWLFSSPKGSFNVLIYMHRYRPDTVSVVLNDYLREFRAKLSSRQNHLEALSISASVSQGEKTKP